MNGVTTYHVWDRGNIVLELNASGAVVNRFDRGVRGQLIRSQHHGWYLHDARGSVVQRTNAQGNVLHTYRYSAFGNEIGDSTVSQNPFRFNGEMWDAHRGEYYLRARSFNPRTGRFSQPDPFFHVLNGNINDSPLNILQAGNLYMFVMHNPVMFADPWGLFAQDVLLQYIVEQNNGTIELIPSQWPNNLNIGAIVTIGDIEHQFMVRSGAGGMRRINDLFIICAGALMDAFGLTQAQATHHAYTSRFSSKENAVLAWGLIHHPLSRPTSQFPNGSEWGSWIYQDGDGRFLFGGDPANRGVSFVQFGPQNPNFTAVAGVHTHPNPGRGFAVEQFSFADQRWANHHNVPLFLVAPSGIIRQLDNGHSVRAGDGLIRNSSRRVTRITRI